MAMLLFFLLTVLVLSIYDLRCRRVPNIVTLPLIGLGLVLHFPGTLETWMGSAVLLLFGFLGGGRVGFGDVKLWLAYFWMLPLEAAGVGVLIGFLVIFLTSLAQIIYFRWRKIAVNQSYPAAWRVFLAVLIVSIRSYLGIHYA